MRADGSEVGSNEQDVIRWLLKTYSESTAASVPQSAAGPPRDLITISEAGIGGGTIQGINALNLTGVLTLATGGALETVVSLAEHLQVTHLHIILGIVGLLVGAHTAFTSPVAERDATVLWTLWVNRIGDTDLVEKQNLLEKVNTELSSYRRLPLMQGDLDSSLAFWRRHRCIVDAKLHWRVVEKVRVRADDFGDAR